jgi:hypothetical protein
MMPTRHYRLKLISRILALTGNSLAAISCVVLAAGMLGLYDMSIFDFGLSSGVRMVGTFAIAGCLLSAIGYGITDYLNPSQK